MLTASDRQHIISLDVPEPASLIKLNRYLSEGDPLSYLTVREKLLSLSYPELSRIQADIDGESSLGALNGLIKDLLSQTKDIFLLREDIFVNNTPLLIDSPFYPDSGKIFKITDIKPLAEFVYFYNFKLPYKKNNLLQKEDQLWYNGGISRQVFPEDAKSGLFSKEEPAYSYAELAHNASKLWSYQLKEDYVNNYFIKLRQWIKRYEEDLVFPVVDRDVAIVRNEYRFFFIDILSGTELSSFSLPDKKGHEYYHTFRYPHQNSYGYEFLLSGDMLFSELNGKLVAVDLKNILHPQLIWEWTIGEYTVCAKPILVNDTLIAGFINSRGEIWMCGFNAKSGSLEWSTYIGMSSFLSPVSTIFLAEDNRVFIGTNHGVLTCLEPESGNIIWVKRYSPKKYYIFNYWYKAGYKDYFLNKGGSIAYDTQFIKIEDNHTLYYKPRESDYLYILDSRDGSLKDKILIDPEKSQLIGICSGKGIFLWKDIKAQKKAELKVIDLASGKQVYAQGILGNALKGVLYPSPFEVLFKIDNDIYFFRADNTGFMCIPINIRTKGWLSARGGSRFLFVVDDRTISCLDLFKQQYPYKRVNLLIAEYLSQRKQIKDSLTSMLRSNNPADEEPKRKLLSEIISSKVPLSEIYPILANNLKSLQHPAWKEFLVGLEKVYGGEVVTCRDIEIKFSNFLRDSRLIDKAYLNNKDTRFPVDKNKIIDKKDYQLKLNGETAVLPIQVIRGPKLAKVFLLLSHGQLLCVAETREILWERKIFYGPIWESGTELDQDRHIYAADLEAYLYDGVLIINDRINVVAVDVLNGTYIWSVTNKEGLFREEGLFPPLSTEWSYQSKKLFVKYTMFYTKFLEDRLIIIHGSKVYSLDPKTGYCQRHRELNTEGVMEAKVADKEIYLLSYSLKNIKVLNKDLDDVRSLSTSFLDGSKETWPEMFFINGYLLLHLRPELFVINGNTGDLTGTLNLSQLKRYYIQVCQDSPLVIEPLRRITRYSINNSGLAAIWEYKADSPDPYSIWEPRGRKSKYCLYDEGCLYFFFRTKGEYFVSSIDFTTGRQLLKRPLKDVKGPFYNLSPAMNSGNGIINFMISTVYTGEMPYQTDILQAAIDAFAETTVDIDSRLIWLNVRNGNIARTEILPSGGFVEKGASMAETENNFIYNIYGSYLKVVTK